MNYKYVSSIESIKEAERIQYNGSKNVKEKIDIYHEAAEACRSIGKFYFLVLLKIF